MYMRFIFIYYTYIGLILTVELQRKKIAQPWLCPLCSGCYFDILYLTNNPIDDRMSVCLSTETVPRCGGHRAKPGDLHIEL